MDALSTASVGARRLGEDLGANLRFFTRLPWPGGDCSRPDFQRIAWAAPLAGALVGLVGAAALLIAHGLRLPASMTAAFGLAAMIAATGAMHEDGLADLADGFGGGQTREGKLTILRDSRLGTYGVAVLILSFLLRAGAIAATLRQGELYGVAAFALCGALAKFGALAPIALLPPAREDGAGASAGIGVDQRQLRDAGVTSVVLAIALGALSLGIAPALFAVVVAFAAAIGIVGLAHRQIGGQTGDVAGAAAVCAEIGAWTALFIGFSPA